MTINHRDTNFLKGNILMKLKEILTKIVHDKLPILLNDGETDRDALALLETLSEVMLQKSAHLQPGLFIAEMNSEGYLGQVLYKIKQNDAIRTQHNTL